MIGKRGQKPTSENEKSMKPVIKKVKEDLSEKHDSELDNLSESEQEPEEIQISKKETTLDTENMTFEFFPANPYFEEYVGFMIKKAFSFMKVDMGCLIRKICDQTEMGIFVGTEDDDSETVKPASNYSITFYSYCYFLSVICILYTPISSSCSAVPIHCKK